MKRFSEQFQIGDLDRNAVSDLTGEWLWDRQKNGIDDFKFKNLSINKTAMRLTFFAEPTYITGASVDNVSTDGKTVRGKGYYVQFDYLEPEKFLGGSSSFSAFSDSEQRQLVKDYIADGMVKVFCTCPAFYYQGHFEAMASHDSTIYKFPGPKGTGQWASRHSMGLKDNNITICKHLAAVIEQMKIYEDDVWKALKSASWGSSNVVEEPEEEPEEEIIQDEELEVEDLPEEESLEDITTEDPEADEEL